jgi:hypothetical protein
MAKKWDDLPSMVVVFCKHLSMDFQDKISFNYYACAFAMHIGAIFECGAKLCHFLPNLNFYEWLLSH